MYHGTIKWVYTDIFALLKMDIAHLVSHALAGLTQLSIHCRACDIKVIRTFYIGERLNGVNKKPISVKSQWNFTVCTSLGAEPKPLSPKTAPALGIFGLQMYFLLVLD